MKLKQLSINRNWQSFLNFRNRKLQGVQTGIPVIDRTLLGLGGITTIQGAPGVNKSTLALQIVHHNLKLGNPALVLDRENGLNRFRARLICQAERIAMADLLTCSKEQLRGHVQQITDYPLYVACNPIRDRDHVKELLQEIQAAHPGKPMLLMVDSIQKMPLPKGAGDKKILVYSWMEAFDQLKLDFEGKLTTLIVSEKKRGSYETAALDGGKESGSLEYTGELVLDLRASRSGSEIICEVVKNRDGESGIAVDLKKVFANPANPQSFCYLLEGNLGVLDG